MRKQLALLLAGVMALSLTACGGSKPAETTAAPAAAPAAAAPAAESKAEEAAPAAEGMDALIEAAKADGSLTVYGSCEEEYLAAACKNFEKMYGIKTVYQRLSTSEVYTKIKEENGKPSGDVWFGGTTDPYNEAVADGLLEAYDAENASHLLKDTYKDPGNNWFGIYKGILGFMVNNEELQRLGIEAPKTWDDLTKPEYKGLIMLSNPNTAGTAKLVINTMVQMKGHDEAMEYFKKDVKSYLENYDAISDGRIDTTVIDCINGDEVDEDTTLNELMKLTSCGWLDITVDSSGTYASWSVSQMEVL